jgi:hypothetical protein
MGKDIRQYLLIKGIFVVIVCVESLIRVGYNKYPIMIIILELFVLSLLIWKVKPYK